MDTFDRRLTRVEAGLAALTDTVNATALDVRAVRDHLLIGKGRRAGAWKVLAIIGGIMTGAATLALGVSAIAGMFHG